MASIQDRLKIKRVNCDAWTTREQLYLASSVLKSGDQNWMSVSRSLKPLIEKESLRPPDWFSQKSCAMQYAYLLENADTPKRKKRESGETTSESIVRRLTQERITELSQILACQKDEYLRLKADINLLKSGAISDEKLEKMWLEIQQEERESDQKARAHMAWLTKRQQQQKQEMNLPSVVSSSITSQTRKHAEGTLEVAQTELTSESATENDDERKNNRGGRSPLLTSLLKSPSPTTQTVQTYPSTPVQVSSPTITSLLGSNSKILNAQLAQNVSPQLQQLVSTAIASANATPPPSVGAPTLSMLLEMPATTQRGPLPKLQTTTSVMSHVQQQQSATVVVTTTNTEMHKFEQTTQSQSQIRQMNIQNEMANAATVTIPTVTTISAAAPTTSALTPVVTAPTNVPVSENMVQIIDHIDDVIRKDIMADVMDKDEINEIIGDIEELIKEEITGSPQTLDTSVSTTTTTTSTAVISNLSSMPQTAEIPIVVPEPKPEPRDVDETVSLSDSPRSEMAIEEIDSSTSNIAEIIGTVAIEPQEPKIIVAEITEIVSNTSEEIKSEPSTCDDERVTVAEELASELGTNDEENSKDTPMEEKQPDIEMKSMDAASSNIEDSKLSDEMKETMEDTVVEAEVEEENAEKEEETEMITHDDKELSETVKEPRESPEDTEGDQQDVPSTEVISVSSEVTNDLPSTEDTEKSQDISLILEDDESSQNSENKKKTMAEEQIIENTVESTESLESFKEESIILMKEKIVPEIKEESLVKSQEEEAIEETLEIYTDEFKKEEVKDSSEDTTNSILQDVEIKEEVSSEPINGAENNSPVVTVEEVKSIKSEPIEIITDVDVNSIKKIESVEVKPEESKTEKETDATATGAFCAKSPLPPEEDKKEIVEIKQEKEDIKKNVEGEQSIKKEIEPTEEPGELDEEESSLSKLSGGRAMKTYSKKQNIAVDSEPENEGTGEGADYRAWKKAVMLVYNRLATHKYASVFLRPITEDQAPGYHSVIFRPMDLSTVKKNIDNGTIRSTMHFQRDVMLMFQNAIMYNKHDTFIYKMAVSMQEECLQHMQILVQVTGEGTFRRETRTATSSSSEASESSIKRKRSHITPSPHDTDTPRSKKRRKSISDDADRQFWAEDELSNSSESRQRLSVKRKRRHSVSYRNRTANRSQSCAPNSSSSSSDSIYAEISPKVSTVRFIFCCIALGLCSTLLILTLWNPNTYIPTIRTYVLHLDRQQPLLHTISDKFLSVGLDTSLLRKMNELPVKQEEFINLGRHLSPAYVRVGGTSADCLIFDQNQIVQSSSEKILSPVDGQDISNFTITGADLLAVYNFAVKSKLRMIFDLNVLLRNPDGSWNDTNAQEIITFAKNQAMELDWQLGNEPNSFKHVFNVTISANELAKNYDRLRQLLDEAGYVDSILIGPEVNHVGEQNYIGEKYAEIFLRSQSSTVNYVTWHQYYLNGREAIVKDFVNPLIFNWLSAQIKSLGEFIAASGKNVSMWLSETSTAYGGGAPELSDRFVAGFLWLDKLGYSASAGLNVVTRQSLFGGNYAMVSPNLTPNPDWWVSVFYKQFVSEKVLKLVTSNNFGYVRLYAHCTPKEARVARVPAVTIYGMNIDKIAVHINIPELFVQSGEMMKIFFYSLTADNLQSSEIKLNGQVLKLRSNGDLPPFQSIILDPTDPVILPPYSMIFMIVHGIDIPVCE